MNGPGSHWRVTPSVTSTPRRSFKTSEIDGISVSRAPLYGASAASSVAALAAWGLSDLIYIHELVVLAMVLAGLNAVGAAVGVLHFTIAAERGTEQSRVVGPIWCVNQLRRDWVAFTESGVGHAAR